MLKKWFGKAEKEIEVEEKETLFKPLEDQSGWIVYSVDQDGIINMDFDFKSDKLSNEHFSELFHQINKGDLLENGLAFIRHTLLPWIRRIEDGFSSLLPGKQFVRLDTDEYARGDQLSRVRSYQVAISSGVMTPNEARAKMELEPYEGGDKFYIGLQGALIDPTLPAQGIDEHDPTNELNQE